MLPICKLFMRYCFIALILPIIWTFYDVTSGLDLPEEYARKHLLPNPYARKLYIGGYWQNWIKDRDSFKQDHTSYITGWAIFVCFAIILGFRIWHLTYRWTHNQIPSQNTYNQKYKDYSTDFQTFVFVAVVFLAVYWVFCDENFWITYYCLISPRINDIPWVRLALSMYVQCEVYLFSAGICVAILYYIFQPEDRIDPKTGNRVDRDPKSLWTIVMLVISSTHKINILSWGKIPIVIWIQKKLWSNIDWTAWESGTEQVKYFDSAVFDTETKGGKLVEDMDDLQMSIIVPDHIYLTYFLRVILLGLCMHSGFMMAIMQIINRVFGNAFDDARKSTNFWMLFQFSVFPKNRAREEYGTEPMLDLVVCWELFWILFWVYSFQSVCVLNFKIFFWSDLNILIVACMCIYWVYIDNSQVLDENFLPSICTGSLIPVSLDANGDAEIFVYNCSKRSEKRGLLEFCLIMKYMIRFIAGILYAVHANWDLILGIFLVSIAIFLGMKYGFEMDKYSVRIWLNWISLWCLLLAWHFVVWLSLESGLLSEPKSAQIRTMIGYLLMGCNFLDWKENCFSSLVWTVFMLVFIVLKCARNMRKMGLRAKYHEDVANLIFTRNPQEDDSDAFVRYFQEKKFFSVDKFMSKYVFRESACMWS